VTRCRSPEATIQRAVFQHLRARGVRGLVAFHVPNGGYRRPAEAAIMKGLGVVAGACIAALREAGAFTCIAEGLDRALACLEAWGLLRGRAQ
jgi:hypothetical protein